MIKDYSKSDKVVELAINIVFTLLGVAVIANFFYGAWLITSGLLR